MSGIFLFYARQNFFFFRFDLNLQVELASLQWHVLMNTLFTTETEQVFGEAVIGQRGKNKDECKRKKGRACEMNQRPQGTELQEICSLRQQVQGGAPKH